MQKQYIYMLVSDDELELPIAIADTARELSELIGVNHRSIYECIRMVEKNRSKRSQYVRVEMDADERMGGYA